MPSLLRFLAILAVLGLLAAGGLVALATFVEPEARDVTFTVPADRLLPPR